MTGVTKRESRVPRQQKSEEPAVPPPTPGGTARVSQEIRQSVLVVDVGGTNIKIIDSHHTEPVKIPSGPTMTAHNMVTEVQTATRGWSYSAISIGYPGPVRAGKPLSEPHNLAPGWIDLDFEKAFGVPVRIINDAAMQALGSYNGGRMLFLGLGTGLGSALIVEGVLQPMELAHLPIAKDVPSRITSVRAGSNGWARPNGGTM